MARESAHSDTEEALGFIVESRSAHETKSWGRRLASLLEGGELLGLTGELGAGKTCFVKGLAHGLALREHHGRLPLYHIDLYRLERAVLDDLGLREYLFSEAVAAVEWFDRLDEAEGLEALSIRIGYSGANHRTIEFRARGSRHSEIVGRLRSRFA
jgi:tRNA threonylcarbamoyladenosine biosynthesis protein TsaE